VVFIAAFLLYDGTHVRYLLPAVPALALGAAAFLRRIARGPGLVVAIVLTMVPVVQAVRLDWVLGQTDTRTLAAERIVALTERGDVLAVDGFGSYYGPPLLATAASLERLPDEIPLNRSEERVVVTGGPGPGQARDVVPVARFYRFDSYYPSDYLLGSTPLEVDAFMASRAVSVYVQVDRKPDEVRRQPVTDMTATRGRLLWEVTPTGSSPPLRAELPTDMGRAFLDVWRYRRPGPWVRVWALLPESP
jgi:hypothetical protein